MTNELRAQKTRVLVERTQEGDPRAREELFERYSAPVLGLVRKRLGARLRRREQSADILQSAMLEALKGLDTFEMRDEGSLVRWLARVVETTITSRVDYHGAKGRDMDREQSLEQGGRSPEGATRPLELAAARASLTRELIQGEEHSLLRGCVANLPERYRKVIELHDFEGADWSEIVRQLALPSENAARMVHLRAVERLGEVLRRKGIGR